MRPSISRTRFLWLAGLGMLASSPALASAGLIVSNTSYGFGGDHSTSYTVDIKFLYDDVIAGPFTTHFASDPTHSFLTFCVDLTHAVAAGDIDSVVTTGSIGTIADGRDIGAAGWVLSTYTDAAGNPVGLSGGDTNRDYAAIQVAIWKLTYDAIEADKRLDKGSYRFKDMDSQVGSLAQGMVDSYWTSVHATTGGQAALDRSVNVGFIDNPPDGGMTSGHTSQDQIFIPALSRAVAVAAPEPSSFLLAAIGVLALAWYNRRHGRDPS